MDTLVGVLMLASPFAGLAAALVLRERRDARRHAALLRQRALTDAIHAHLGAVVAPVVQRRGGTWRVSVAVPFERPAVVTTVLALVNEFFAASTFEVVLRRQAAPVADAVRRPAPVGKESLSWT